MSLLQRKGVKAVSGLVVELCAVAGLVALSGTIRLPRAAAADELPATETQPSGLALELVPGSPIPCSFRTTCDWLWSFAKTTSITPSLPRGPRACAL